MTICTSLGLHVSVGYQYLVAEGLSPAAPTNDDHQAHTYVLGDDEQYQEEIVFTKRTVVWSCGNAVRALYDFEFEGEDVRQAFLTHFDRPTRKSEHHTTLESDKNALHSQQTCTVGDTTAGRSHNAGHTDQDGRSRALIVVLTTKIHIYFLTGPHHVVDLPFPIRRAWPSPRGILLQRPLDLDISRQASPEPLVVPHNSFFSSQIQPSSFTQRSPSVKKSFAASQSGRDVSQVGGEVLLDKLWNNIQSPSDKNTLVEEDTIFSLSDPLSELGLVVQARKVQSRLLFRPRASNKVAFENIDSAETIVYISAQDELAADTRHSCGDDASLILLVTENAQQQTMTIWHCWYLHGRSLSDLMQHSKQKKTDKARRRSSFISASAGTGTTTPALRTRDNQRESFINLPSVAGTRSRKALSQDPETAIASQLDPDFEDYGSQSHGNDGNRRISSIVSRGELGVVDQRNTQTAATSSFAASSFRRNTSLGLNDRRSLGLRRSRTSTNGSVMGRSRVTDDDDMDLDSELGGDDQQSLDEILDDIRSTYDTMDSEFLSGVLDEGWKQDFVMRQVRSFNLPLVEADPKHSIEQYSTLVTHAPAVAKNSNDEASLTLHVHHKSSKMLWNVEMHVRQCRLYEEPEVKMKVAVPFIKQYSKQTSIESIQRISDFDIQVMAINGHSLLFPGQSAAAIDMPTSTYVIHNPLALLRQTEQDVETGKHRTLAPPPTPHTLFNAGVQGTFTEAGPDEMHHRRLLRLAPVNHHIRSILKTCEIVLPEAAARNVRSKWFSLHLAISSKPQLLVGTACDTEWIAAAAMIFSFALGLLDQKCLAAAKVARIAASRQRRSSHGNFLVQQHSRASALSKRGPWSKLNARSDRDPGRGSSTRGAPDQALPIALTFSIDHQEQQRGHDGDVSSAAIAKLILGLHILREEGKLTLYQRDVSDYDPLAAIIAQLGAWLNLTAWSYVQRSYYYFEGASETDWAFVRSTPRQSTSVNVMNTPIGVMEWLEHLLINRSDERYPSLDLIASTTDGTGPSQAVVHMSAKLTPRIIMLSKLSELTSAFTKSPVEIVEAMAACGLTTDVLDSLPAGIAAPCREALRQCERSPPATWSSQLLKLVAREDLDRPASVGFESAHSNGPVDTIRDQQTICTATDQAPSPTRTQEADRNAVSQLIFHADRRLVHAASILHFNTVQLAECAKQPEWTDAFYFEQQRRVMQFVTTRTVALPVGDAMLHYDSQSPLMTERYHLPGFNSTCIMQPSGHTVTTDRSGLTEEKISWAYFHAGTSTGLRISRRATGIDTSWLVFNKPNDLTNRHAGLLLALGLNGHLKHVAKWLSFKYLTPKHSMTSLGLLLGLAASNIGTMDSLVTRMLSVHITCMLPPGAAELNVSPLTQTAGLLGIGLLYHDTQHRRMSETMLQEIETLGVEDPDCGPDALRDESYRLAAGFALGLINIRHGHELRGLQGMQLEERLLRIAVGARPVRTVHVFDKSTAGAIMALAMIFMKSKDEALARKLDVPDTEQQYEYIRPDMLMLRSMTKHIILWTSIAIPEHSIEQDKPSARWIPDNLPACCKDKWARFHSSRVTCSSADLPFFYILTGLAWAMSLKYAGSGDKAARNEILAVLDLVWHCLRKRPDDNYFYDAKSSRTGLRRCVDVLTLFAATVMAGTGDVVTFRYLRRLHGKTDAETLYGSHLASHMGIGLLFLGGGTLTVGTSDLAIASLMCSLYPLFPVDVQDNRVHLQAFRHLWVFAVESRCLTVEDIDTGRPMQMPLLIHLTNGSTLTLQAPCLLPDLDTIASLRTTGPSHWPVALDFLTSNNDHVKRFRQSQKIYVKRCPPSVAHDSVFWIGFASADSDSLQTTSRLRDSLQWIMDLRAIKRLDQKDVEWLIPQVERITTMMKPAGNRVDDRLMLLQSTASNERDRLWDLRVLFAWAEALPLEQQKGLRWLSMQVVQDLRCRIEARQRQSPAN